VLRFSGRPGQQSWIVASSDLQQWKQIYLVSTANDNPIEFRDMTAQPPQRFYRVVGIP
jgi:hypothetical protein